MTAESRTPERGLRNAASIAALVLTTESLVTEIPQETPSMPAPPPMDY